MSNQQASVIPAIPVYALMQIQDANTRLVLQSIVDGLQVRNAATGDGSNAFITRGDLTTVTGARVSNGRLGIFPTFADLAKGFTGGASSGAVVADIEASLADSLLFQQLGQSVSLLNTNLTAEQTARVNAVQAVADNLAAETLARTGLGTTLGGQIATIQTASDDNATLITALGTWKFGAQSNITTLLDTTSTQATALTNMGTRVTGAESSITTLNTTTGNQASALTSLTTRVGTAETSISTLNTTTGNQATSLTAINATLGQKANTYFQTSAPTGTIATGSLWFDSDDNNKPYRWNGSAWQVVESTVNLASVMASITSEHDARVSADNAITSSVTSQFSTVNGSISTLNSTTSTLTTNVSTLSNSVFTLTAQYDATQTSVQQEAQARSDADGTLFARYSIKTDVNGYVSGYGLMSTANNSTPTSEFIVRADKFAIASPTGPGITPTVPFSVLTTTDAHGNAPGVYMDMAIMKAASITGAYIQDLAVDTIKISENAVIIADYAEGINNMGVLNTVSFSRTTEYRWEDDNTLVSGPDIDTIRGKTSISLRFLFANNPNVLVQSDYGAVMVKFPARNYMGQPVLIMHDQQTEVSTTASFEVRLYRVEEAAGILVEPNVYNVAKIPRSCLSTGMSLGQISDMEDAQITTRSFESVWVSGNYYNGQPYVNFKIVNSGFLQDNPPVGKNWRYIYKITFGTDDSSKVTKYQGPFKLTTMGLKR